MNKIQLLKVSLFTSLILLFLFPVPVKAQPEATSDYKINVNILENGEVEIEYYIHLVNQSDEFFIRDYSLIVEHSDLTNLSILENGEQVNFRKEFADNKIKIKVYLSRQLVKKDDSSDIYVKYTTKELHETDGLLELFYIPPIETEEGGSREFTVSIPGTHEDSSFISKKDATFEINGDKKLLKYSQDEVPRGLLIIFGKKQQFEFTYTYQLKNETSETKVYTITLPADEGSQQVYFIDSPVKPDRTKSDIDGNNLVEYVLEKDEVIDVRISGYSYLQSHEGRELDYELIEKYKSKTFFWDYESEEVAKILEEIVSVEGSSYETAGRIYDYLLSHYKYTTESTGRLAASELAKGGGALSCENFSDLSVALLRGRGIPAREVIGYSNLSEDISSLHYWVEFYDFAQAKWVGMDPCMTLRYDYFEFDNLDLDRFIIAYRGISQEGPSTILPFTKYQDNGNNLEIHSSSYEFSQEEQWVRFNYEVQEPDLFFHQIPLKLTISNNSLNIFKFEKVLVDSKETEYFMDEDDSYFFESVFPGCESSITVYASPPNDFSVERVENYTLEVFGSFGKNVFYEEEEFKVSRPFTYYHVSSWALAFVLSLATLAFFLWSIKKLGKKPWKNLSKLKEKITIPRLKEFLSKRLNIRATCLTASRRQER